MADGQDSWDFLNDALRCGVFGGEWDRIDDKVIGLGGEWSFPVSVICIGLSQCVTGRTLKNEEAPA